MTIAMTGATGFVGGRLLEKALSAGHEVRALARRPQDERQGVTWVEGSLEDEGSLARLAHGADAVIHVAGVINAADEYGFERANVIGTGAMLAAAERAGVDRFVHVSSLAAREPKLSAYGNSKARSELLVERSNLDWAIVRPPAVYGPGDRETLDLFRMARRGQVWMPPAGRLSLIHADDLARLLLVLAATDAPARLTLEPDDGRSGGWTHRELGEALGRAVGTKARTIHAPRALLHAGARLDRLVRGSSAKLTPDRVAYFCHPDWAASEERKPAPSLWQAEIPADEGLRETAEWYRREGWL